MARYLYIPTGGTAPTDAVSLYYNILAYIFFICFFYIVVVSVFSKRTIPFAEALQATALSFYVIFGFNCIVLLRDVHNGQYIYLLIFVSAWLTDTGAYIIGSFLGRHKLIEDVSPKKTVEGAVGGVLFCIISFVLYSAVIGAIFDKEPQYIPLIIIAVISSVISQCGDLIASLIKRNYNMKDYSNIFPGHGGVMDRFDSIIAVAPFLFILNNTFSYFGLFG
jgi:phosphatidate cytidylyltransferase